MDIILKSCFGATKVNSAVYLPGFFLGWVHCLLSLEDGEIALSDTVQFYCVGTRVKSWGYFLVYRTYGGLLDSSGPSLLFTEGTRNEKKNLNLPYTRVYQSIHRISFEIFIETFLFLPLKA